MSTLTRHLSRVRRAAVAGLLVAVPLMPLSACADGSGNGGDGQVETEEEGGGGEGDDGAY
jgi:hypothetical protein